MKDVPAGVDLIPGVYEGGLKVWESSVDLAQCIRKEDGLQIKRGQKVLEVVSSISTCLLLQPSFVNVLTVFMLDRSSWDAAMDCPASVPCSKVNFYRFSPVVESRRLFIFFFLNAGADVCFMDLNEEVLRGVTRWNIELNLSTDIRRNGESEVLLISGEWTDASEVLRQQR